MIDQNPKITRLFYQLTLLECVVLVMTGVGLFFLPSLLDPLWPWELTPFNTRFLGGIYLGSLASAVLLTLIGRWLPARVVVPMILIFTLIVLAVSLVYLERFNKNTLSNLGWFGLYSILPLNAAYYLWLHRQLPPAPGVKLPALLLNVLRLSVLILGGYGILLLIAPGTFGTFWPWVLDDFHARMYSAAFMTPALGLGLLLRSATSTELQTVGVTGLVGGIFPIIGLLLVEANVQRINWSLPGTWLWIIIFMGNVVGGLWLLSYSQRVTSSQ